MAFELIDKAMGLVPIRTPLESQTTALIVTDGVTVYPGMVVDLTSGEITIHAAAATGPVLGVCLDYIVGDGELKATVCTDPDMVYKAVADVAIAASAFGQYCDMASNGGSTTTRIATGVVDGAPITGTPTALLILTFLGEYESVHVGTNLIYQFKLNNLITNYNANT